MSVVDDPKTFGRTRLSFADAQDIKAQCPDIDLVSPMKSDSMAISYDKVEKPHEVMGIVPAYSPMTDVHVTNGRFISDQDVQTSARVVVLGSERAEEFFSTDNPVGKTMIIGGAGYTVIGVQDEKYFSFDQKRNVMRWMNKQMYIPITTMMVRTGEPIAEGRVSSMNARMKNTKRHKDATDQIEAVLKRNHGVKDFQVLSRVANLKRNEANNKMYDVLFMVCGLISLIVGGIVVMNIQLASFNERVREVGTRKAVGASPLQIFSQFLSHSVLVSIFGGVIGIFVGKFFCDGISMLTRNAAVMTPDVIVKALIFAAGTGLVFGMYPAFRASRLNSIEALRTE